MRFLPFALVLGLAVGGWWLRPRPAEAADFYKFSLVPGADAGTTASSTALIGGNQYMLRCSSYAVTYKLCEQSATCTATGNDSPIDADQSIDICGLTNFTGVSVFRTYDGGVPTCRVYNVNPPSPLCKL
jgi:hypothetical protein